MSTCLNDDREREKKTAAQNLLKLSCGTATPSIINSPCLVDVNAVDVCPVCSRPLDVKLMHRRLSQQNFAEKEAVKELRYHCLQFHRNEFLWEAMPQNGKIYDKERSHKEVIGTVNSRLDDVVDEFLLHSLVLASLQYRYEEVRSKKNLKDWELLSAVRFAHAIAWMKVGSKEMLCRKLDSAQKRQYVKTRCLEELVCIRDAVMSQLIVDFHESMRSVPIRRWINRYQLLFVEYRRYKLLYSSNYFLMDPRKCDPTCRFG